MCVCNCTWMQAYISYPNTSLMVPCSLEICKSNLCLENFNQFFKRKLLLSYMAFFWSKIEMVKCCDLLFLSLIGNRTPYIFSFLGWLQSLIYEYDILTESWSPIYESPSRHTSIMLTRGLRKLKVVNKFSILSLLWWQSIV